MENPLQNIQTQIEKLGKSFCFQFINISTNDKLKKDYATPFNSSLVWTYEDVLKKYGSVIGLFTHMQKNLGAEGVTIAFRKPNGDRSLKTNKQNLTITFKDTSKSMENNKSTQPQQTTYTPAPAANYNPAPQITGLGGASQVGLGFAQVLDYEKKANRLELLEEHHAKQKKQIETLETLNQKLQRELDEANSKCRLAEDRKNFEVEKAEAKKQSFITPELIDAVMKNAPGILQSFSGQGGAPQQTADTGLGNPYANLTRDQQTLINEIAQGNLNENQQFIIYQIVEGLKTNPNLEVQLAAMFNQ